MKIKIDYSTLSAYRRCPTYFKQRYHLGHKAPETSIYLDFGMLLHLGLELLYQTPKLNFSQCATFKEIEYLCGTKGVPETAATTGFLGVLHKVALAASSTSVMNIDMKSTHSLRHLLTLLMQYVVVYFPDDITPTHFELSHSIKLADDIEYCVNMDMLSAMGPIEHKTAAWGKPFEDRIMPNNQALGYIAAARDFLKDDSINMVLFNGILKSGFGLKTKEEAEWPIFKNPQSCFKRLTFFATETMLQNWRVYTEQTIRRLMQDIKSGIFDMSAPDACQFMGGCSFKKVCMNELDLTNLPKEPWKGFKIEE